MQVRRVWIGFWGALLGLLAVHCAGGEKSDPPPILGAPMLATVSPPVAARSGGTQLTLGGENFASGALVFIDGQPATAVFVLSSSRMVATAPPRTGAGGKAAVVVRNPDGQQTLREDLFTYYDELSLHTGRPYLLGSIPKFSA